MAMAGGVTVRGHEQYLRFPLAVLATAVLWDIVGVSDRRSAGSSGQ